LELAISGDFPPRLVLTENGRKILTATATSALLGLEVRLYAISLGYRRHLVLGLALRRRKALLDVVQRWKFAYGRFAPAQILALAIRDAGPHTATNQQEDAGGRCDR